MELAFPSQQDLEALFRRHHGDPKKHGWRVQMHHQFAYYSTQNWYEAVVDHLVTEETKWIDVGGGKTVFPHNAELSTELAARCKLLVGIDPSPNIQENTLVHEKSQTTIEDFQTDEQFDLATLQMVAEHIPTPRQAVEALAKLVRPGGYVVIYTPNRWSPVSMAASLIPNQWHSFFTNLLWSNKAEDVFPTCYAMNTRKRLDSLFSQAGFEEAAFRHLSNCCTFQRFRITCWGELCFWRILRSMRITYPENDLLGVYRRV